MNTLYTFFLNNIILNIVLTLILILFILFELINFITSKNSINPTTAIKLINQNNAILIDFRTEILFKTNHIINAINIPLNNINKYHKQLKKYKKNTIIIIYNNNYTARKIIKLLKNITSAKTIYMHNGINAWINNKLPTIKDTK